LASPWRAAPQYHLPRTGSTADDARLLARSAPADGALITADYQTRGRGRNRDRRWVSEPRRNLLFNLLLSADTVGTQPQRLPLVTGLAVARAVQAASGLTCRVKWPNDVVAGGCKIAGCLCERTAGWFSVGVGVTCNQRRGLPPGAPGELAASSILLQSGRQVRRWVLLEAILAALHRALAEPDWAPAVDRRLFLRGEWVHLDDAGRGLPRVARVIGVAEAGGLAVVDEDGCRHTCFAGSLRLRDGGAGGLQSVASRPGC
jgi:BirA family biotin operon repressor/biotin-[acetyl-CoA-carboxylase] ligase